VELVHSTVAILRVAIEPQKSSDIAALARGLQILNQADAHVEILGKKKDYY
jgi:translation elongation factor EF-G